MFHHHSVHALLLLFVRLLCVHLTWVGGSRQTGASNHVIAHDVELVTQAHQCQRLILYLSSPCPTQVRSHRLPGDPGRDRGQRLQQLHQAGLCAKAAQAGPAAPVVGLRAVPFDGARRQDGRGQQWRQRQHCRPQLGSWELALPQERRRRTNAISSRVSAVRSQTLANSSSSRRSSRSRFAPPAAS